MNLIPKFKSIHLRICFYCIIQAFDVAFTKIL